MSTANVPRGKFRAGRIKGPDKSWSERNHYIREDEPRSYGEDPLRMENTPTQVDDDDIGRSERFPSGWWIFPGMLIAVLVLGVIAL